jgi:hypothetical protein
MSAPASQRKTILAAVQTRLKAKFSAEKGATEQLFREIWVKPWQPGNKVRPAAWIVDNGARRSGTRSQSESGKDRILQFQVIIDLDDNFDRPENYVLWQNRIEAIAAEIQNLDPKAGVRRMDYQSDDPFEAIIPGAASEQIWLIEFECEFFIDAGNFD